MLTLTFITVWIDPITRGQFHGMYEHSHLLDSTPSFPDEATVRGETPLHLAARANQTDIIRILLRNGAQVDARARVSNLFCLRTYLLLLHCG